MTRPTLAVSNGVVRDMVRLAAMEVPGVLRVGWAGGPLWRVFAGRPVRVHIRDGAVEARVVVVARPGQPLAQLAADVQAAVTAAIERLLGLDLGAVTSRIDGGGG